MRTQFGTALLFALSVAFTNGGSALGQVRLGEVSPAPARPTLAEAIKAHGAKHDPTLALTPPAQPDQGMYWLTGVLMDRIGTLYLVKQGYGYWAYRTSDATQENLVGLRPGDTVAVVGKLEVIRDLRRGDGKTAPTAVLAALYVTNDDSDIPDGQR